MQPNVLIIVLDALRADRVGAFGGRDLTPNIDDLASSSATFTNAFSTSTETEPAVTSVQTGRHPLSHGVVNHGAHVTEREKLTVEQVPQLPEELSASGYRTAKFGRPLGRWHKRGFDVYPEFSEGKTAIDAAVPPTKKQRINSYLAAASPWLRDAVSAIYTAVEQTFGTGIPSVETPSVTEQDVVDRFTDWIDADDPFYAFVHLMDTHGPFEVEPDAVRDCLGRFEYSGPTLQELTAHIDDEDLKNAFRSARDQWDIADYPLGAVYQAVYDAAVRKGDKRVGRIINQVNDRGLLEETLVVFLADHGESLTEHGIYFSHHGLYDQTIQIHLLVRPPGGAHGEHDQLVQLTDIAPTVADYVGIDSLRPDGYTLKPVIESEAELDRDAILAEESNNTRRRAVRTNTEKLIRVIGDDPTCRKCDIPHGSDEQCFDLTADPAEQENIARSDPGRVKRLADIMEAMRSAFVERQPSLKGPGAQFDYEDEDTLVRRMKELGYR
jgi:arylsulfatase A-like enzyme